MKWILQINAFRCSCKRMKEQMNAENQKKFLAVKRASRLSFEWKNPSCHTTQIFCVKIFSRTIRHRWRHWSGAQLHCDSEGRGVLQPVDWLMTYSSKLMRCQVDREVKDISGQSRLSACRRSARTCARETDSLWTSRRLNALQGGVIHYRIIPFCFGISAQHSPHIQFKKILPCVTGNNVCIIG